MKEKFLNIHCFQTVQFKCVFTNLISEPGEYVANPYVAAFAYFLSLLLLYETEGLL